MPGSHLSGGGHQIILNMKKNLDQPFALVMYCSVERLFKFLKGKGI